MSILQPPSLIYLSVQIAVHKLLRHRMIQESHINAIL